VPGCRHNCILLFMQFTLCHVGARSPGGDPFNSLCELYLKRASAFVPSEAKGFRSEQQLLEWLEHRTGRTRPVVVLLDSRGRQMTSEAFAEWIGERRNLGVQQVVFAIGPADGWSDQGRGRAQLLLSFGLLTIAHSLARLVMAEQIYRACTILAGHPYHSGH
jgi:23S rRNA (pseudouridine1915-N3)-methyltransferase